MDININLKKLGKVLLSYDQLDLQKALDDESLYRNWKLFELISAIYAAQRFGMKMFLWNDLDPDSKDKLGLPTYDVGTDYISEDFRLIGQAKCYKKGRISNHCINRTRLNALISCDNGNNSRLIEFSTTDVPLGRYQIKFDKFDIKNKEDLDKFYSEKHRVSYTHTVIDNNIFKEIIMSTKSLEPELLKLLEFKEEFQMDPLRLCQESALNAIKPSGITRLNLSCGSGKTRIGIEYMTATGLNLPAQAKFCVLVPSLVLLEQWYNLLCNVKKAYSVDIMFTRVGTGYYTSADVSKFPKNKILIFICVYNSFEKIKHIKFDKFIIDEAHHVDKSEHKLTGFLKDIAKIDNAIYLSATFGKKDIDYTYGIRQAICDGILNDYDIIVPYYTTELDDDKTDKYLVDYFNSRLEFTSILVYFNRIKEAVKFAELCRAEGILSESITCEESLKERNRKIKLFKEGKIRLIASVNTLGEGIDIPIADVCCFARTRTSEISIVQCVGRILRKHPMKKLSHVIIPMQFNGNELDNDFIKFLRKLARNDPVFIDCLRNKGTGRINLVNMSNPEEEIITETSEKIYELLLDKEGNLLRDSWDINFEQYAEYYRTNGKTPGRSVIIDDGVNLGYWYGEQRKYYANNKLSKIRIEKMDSISQEWRDIKHLDKKVTELSFHDKAELLREYILLNKSLPNSTTVYKDIPIGRWLNDQRTEYKRSKDPDYKKRVYIDDGRIEILNNIYQNWNVTQTINSSARNMTNEQKIEILLKYKNEFNSLPPSSKQYEGFDLGRWLNDQKQRYKTSPENYPAKEKELLDAIDVNWKSVKEQTGKIYELTWDEKLAVLARFVKSNKRGPKANEMYENINIGQWLNNQRKASPEQIEKLKKCLPEWTNEPTIKNNSRTLSWDEKYDILVQYYNEFNSLPPSSKEYGGINIGKWLNTQKTNYKSTKPNMRSRVTQEMVEKLDAINSSWK